jgi:hypothetical protein
MDGNAASWPLPRDGGWRARALGRLVRRLSWGWQAPCVLVFAATLLGLLLDRLRPWPDSGEYVILPVHLLPVLLPAWIPVTAVPDLLTSPTRCPAALADPPGQEAPR